MRAYWRARSHVLFEGDGFLRFAVPGCVERGVWLKNAEEVVSEPGFRGMYLKLCCLVGL
jgi:hypothetical protein